MDPRTTLNLLGVITRQTRDCDILHPALPPEVAEASRAFAAEVTAAGGKVKEDWLNNGPSAFARSTLGDLARRLGHGP